MLVTSDTMVTCVPARRIVSSVEGASAAASQACMTPSKLGMNVSSWHRLLSRIVSLMRRAGAWRCTAWAGEPTPKPVSKTKPPGPLCGHQVCGGETQNHAKQITSMHFIIIIIIIIEVQHTRRRPIHGTQHNPKTCTTMQQVVQADTPWWRVAVWGSPSVGLHEPALLAHSGDGLPERSRHDSLEHRPKHGPVADHTLVSLCLGLDALLHVVDDGRHGLLVCCGWFRVVWRHYTAMHP